MERTLGTSFATITPAAEGWRVRIGAGSSGTHPALDAAAAAVPAETSIQLSLPVGAVVMERMRLPSKDREELGGMVVLQLEKTLPYNGDEITSGFEILSQEENESELLAFAVSNETLDELCAPLRTRLKLPAQVSVFAMQLAAKCAGEEWAALIFREQESVILAVAQHGKLAAAHSATAATREAFLAELPRLLLMLELEGVPVNFSRLFLERSLAGWRDAVAEHFPGTPVELISEDQPFDPGPVNLIPAAWTQERQKQSNTARLRQRLILAGAAYLFLLLVAAGNIIWLQHRVAGLDSQIAALSPAVDSIASRKARWAGLAPALDPARFPVEVLLQVSKSIPGDSLRVTVFEQSPTGFMVEGEAPTASMAIDYGEALRKNPELRGFRFESPPPELLDGERAHFRIFAKL